MSLTGLEQLIAGTDSLFVAVSTLVATEATRPVRRATLLGPGSALADHVIVTPSEHIPRIQEAQASGYHVLRELVG